MLHNIMIDIGCSVIVHPRRSGPINYFIYSAEARKKKKMKRSDISESENKILIPHFPSEAVTRRQYGPVADSQRPLTPLFKTSARGKPKVAAFIAHVSRGQAR